MVAAVVAAVVVDAVVAAVVADAVVFVMFVLDQPRQYS